MKIVRIIYLVLVVVCMQTIVACQDDWEKLNNGADVNTPVTVDLSFGVPRSTEIVLTRADNSESDIYGIRIYIFNGERYLGMREINTLQEVSNDDAGRRYRASNVSLYQGTQTVYAVANITRTGYFQDATGLLTSLEEEAQKGKTEFLAKLYTLASATIEGGNLPQFTTQYMPLSGVGDITVNSATSVQGTVELKRMVAQVNFKINTEQTNSDGHKITFAPLSYIFYNVPEQGYLIEKDNANTPATNYYNTKSVVIGGATGDENQAYFSVYVPENIQTAKQSCQGVYNNREAFEGTGNNKEWTYAPDNGMYVVLKGKYTETLGNSLVKYADVEYTIHLGDFSQDEEDNYSVLRNNIYTYTVTVRGVENIIVEAKRVELLQNSAEGDVVELTAASKMFNLDSHYEQVYVEYDLTEIANSIQMGEGTTDEDLKERIALNFILSIHTPFNTRAASAELVTPYNSDKSEEEGMEGIDYKWVEFLPQSSANSISPYPGQTSDKLLSAWEVCQKMGEAVYQLKNNQNPDNTIFTYNYSDSHWYARFTIFVDEYFYAKDLNGQVVAWESYTHTDPRTMLIASDMRTSEDLNSTYSVALTYITQTSMETFYNGAASDTYNAMGIETYNENGLITGFGTPVTPNSGYTYKDPSMGRANTLVNICGSEYIDSKNLLWTKYIDWTSVGYTDDNTVSGNYINYNKVNSAYYACLSRNRDLNGDGNINDDEVRWYLPALNQYLRMGIGAKALSENARPYTGDKNDLSGNDYINDASLENGALYYMSNYDQNFYWAVEVGSYGSSSASKKAQIRCVRNLPRKSLVESNTTPPVGREAWADALYYRLRKTSDGENYMFYFGSRLLPALYRNSDQPQYGSYIEHTEESEPAINLLPKAFVVSQSYMRTYTYYPYYYNEIYDIDDVCSPDTDPCRNYSENDEWDGYWRTPNLNELMIMVTQEDALELKNYADGASSLLTLCSTRFSNQKVRRHFYFNGNFITTSNAAKAGMVRCVRDASQAEIDNSTIIEN